MVGRLMLLSLFLAAPVRAASLRSAASSPEIPAAFQGPWSVSDLSPVTPDASNVEKAAAKLPVKQTSVPTLFLLGAVKFYQECISPADGSSCLLYPTCSGYSVLTLRKHGPVVGFIMTSERVMRNHTGSYYPSIYKFGRWRNYDPVENNDFWFPSEKAKALAARLKRQKELEGHL